MKNYIGIDLHSNNTYIGAIDTKGKYVFRKKLDNKIRVILKTLHPLKKDNKGIVVESTYNWYWLVDGLQEAGYRVHLANPSAIQQYNGLKHSDDQTDAFWLAEMKRLNILPEGHIYPKETRGIRDLLRKRMLLVRHRTSFYLSIQGMISNNTAIRIDRNALKQLTEETICEYLGETHQGMAATSLNTVTTTLNEEINKIEKIILQEIKLNKPYKLLLTVPGIGKILALTIMLETGDINRFPTAGDYSSYSRCVSSKKISNGKKKGEGNRKNGNKYLSWAYVEAANFIRRYSPEARKWHQKKAAKKGNIVATKALANKISKACYYIIRNQVAYQPEKIFGMGQGTSSGVGLNH